MTYVDAAGGAPSGLVSRDECHTPCVPVIDEDALRALQTLEDADRTVLGARETTQALTSWMSRDADHRQFQSEWQQVPPALAHLDEAAGLLVEADAALEYRSLRALTSLAGAVLATALRIQDGQAVTRAQIVAAATATDTPVATLRDRVARLDSERLSAALGLEHPKPDSAPSPTAATHTDALPRMHNALSQACEDPYAAEPGASLEDLLIASSAYVDDAREALRIGLGSLVQDMRRHRYRGR